MEKPKFTIFEQEPKSKPEPKSSAQVHVTHSLPNALQVYASQVAAREPDSLHTLIASHRSRIALAKKKEQVILHAAAVAFAVPSIALVALLLLLVWMLSGPIKAAILAAIIFLIWMVF